MENQFRIGQPRTRLTLSSLADFLGATSPFLSSFFLRRNETLRKKTIWMGKIHNKISKAYDSQCSVSKYLPSKAILLYLRGEPLCSAMRTRPILTFSKRMAVSTATTIDLTLKAKEVWRVVMLETRSWEAASICVDLTPFCFALHRGDWTPGAANGRKIAHVGYTCRLSSNDCIRCIHD